MDAETQTPLVVPFGKYLLDEEIARGGMARVFRARLRGLGGFEKRLVVKQVLPELARDPRFIALFVQEAKTVVEMSHPNIVPVYELGVVDGVYFLAMELVDGATLADILREGKLAPELAAHVGVQLCDALEYAHTRFGLVHRDVTPRNVMVDAAGHARLLDFGIAAPAEGTATGEVFGSHGYMSPEQVRCETLSPRSDLFSLGCVLHEALTGLPVFWRGDPEKTKARLAEGPAPTLLGTGVPDELAKLIDACLERDPASRPASALLVGKRLRGWLAQAHPEGVAPELGARAESARGRAARGRTPERGRTPASRTPNGGRKDPSGIARSLATSAVLKELLGEPGTQPLPRSAPVFDEPGTQRIEGVERKPPEPAEQSTPEVLETAPAGSSTVALARPPVVPDAAPARIAGPRVLGGLFLAVCLAAASVAALWFGATKPGEGARTASSPDAGPPDASSAAPLAAPVDAASEADGGALADAGPPDAAATDAGFSGARVEPVARATLHVNAIPWATVALDGRSLGTTPRRNVQLAAGAHTVVLECPPLGRSARVPVRLAAGGVVSVVVDLTSDPPTVVVR